MRRKFLIRLAMMFGLGVAVFAGLSYYTMATKTTGEQKLAALKGEVFRTTLQGQPRVFLMDNCTLYLLDVSGEEIKRKEVLSTSFYFLLDSCDKQTIGVEGEYLRVYFHAQAAGAGGGNTTGGEYRSKDGLTWEKLDGGRWAPKK